MKPVSINNTRFQKLLIAITLVAGLFVLAATNAWATLQCYEPYNYTMGATPTSVSGTPTQTTGGGFFGPYNGGAGTKTTVAGLTYSGLGVNNNALQITGGYIGENVSSGIASGTVYISYLVNMPASPTATLSGLEMNTSGNGMFVGITASGGTGAGYLGVNQQCSYGDACASKWQSSTANITYGSTYFIVVKLVGSGSGWTGKIWVNPTAGTSSEPAETGTFTMPQFTISACSIVNPGGGNMKFDELRIGSTWADAVNYTILRPLGSDGFDGYFLGCKHRQLELDCQHRQPGHLQRQARDQQRRNLHHHWHHDRPHGDLHRFSDGWRNLLL